MEGTAKEKAELGCIRWETSHKTMKTKVCGLESLVQKIRFCIEERKLGEGENSSMSWEQNRKCKQKDRLLSSWFI